MIKNDKQYQVTKSRLQDFKKSMQELETQEIDPLLKELQQKAMASQIIDFEEEIKEYERLKEGFTNYVSAENLSDIHEVLIKARIAKKMTQADLAECLEMKEQQIQRYEISNYATASMGRIIEVADALDLRFDRIKARVRSADLVIPDGIDKAKVLLIQKQRQLLKI